MQAVRKLKELPPHVQGHKVIRAVIIETVIMTVEILCCLMPMPWRLIVPIIIGARSIIMQAIRKSREPQRCTCGAPIPKRKKKPAKKAGKRK